MQIVYKELTAVNIKAKDAQDAIRQVGAIMLEKGFVKDSFIEAVVEREKEYPTGLQLQGVGIAMPHTVSGHVHKPGVCIAQLAAPVTFGHMGMPELKVEAEMLFMMAIVDPKEQVDNLKKVLEVFGNSERAREFMDAKSQEQLYEVAAKHLKIGKEEESK